MGLLVILIISLVVNTILSHLVGKNGIDKEIGYKTSFWVSFCFSPLIGLLLVISSKELKDGRSKDDDNYFFKYFLRYVILSLTFISIPITIMLAEFSLGEYLPYTDEYITYQKEVIETYNNYEFISRNSEEYKEIIKERPKRHSNFYEMISIIVITLFCIFLCNLWSYVLGLLKIKNKILLFLWWVIFGIYIVVSVIDYIIRITL